MRIREKYISLTTVAAATVVFLFALVYRPPVVRGAADHVRWDIISLNPSTNSSDAKPGWSGTRISQE
jgi:hypothetical protein